MDKIVVEGGQRLVGEIQISGAKNAALPHPRRGAPAHGREHVQERAAARGRAHDGQLLRKLGCEVEGTGSLTVAPATAKKAKLEAPYELVKTMRASVLVLGPLVARYGRGRVSLPGGCAIGARPIDQHLKGLRRWARKIALEHGYVEVEAKRLRGAEIVLDMPTVTGTENLMMAAALAKGRTTHRERRARARGRGARARAQQDGRAASRAPARGHHDRGRRRAAPVRSRDHPRPHRGRHVRGRRPRSPAATCSCAARGSSTSRP